MLELHGGDRAFSFGAPPLQLADLAAYAQDRPLRSAELAQVARRKLGRVLGLGAEPELLVLSGELREDEAVLDLAYALKGQGTLLTVCPERLVVVRAARPRRALAPAETIPYAAMTAVRAHDDELTVETADGSGGSSSSSPTERPA